jgi:alkane 1-monooxygenase
MRIRVLKYLTPLIVFLLAYFAFTEKGWITFLPLLYAWGFIPLLELFLKPDPSNMNSAEEEVSKNDPFYDYMLWNIVPLQFIALFFFLDSMRDTSLETTDKIGRIMSMGLLCGIFGINVAHELGHRSNSYEQWMAKALLTTSLYNHFFIEHNKGHHKNVATLKDPSSARLGEPLYMFWPRTIINSYRSAWRIANREMRKLGLPIFHWKNEMITLSLLELIFCLLITFIFGYTGLLYFILAAINGALLLETVQYIEHYGLRRQSIGHGKFERTLPKHSWNSDHVIGRLMLFELSRHSDHHYLASRKYQILRHHTDAPQMPTGYPGMMLLSLFPPAWFRVMNPRVR